MDDDVDCTKAMHALYEFLDGELTHERRQHIEYHLNGCPQCFSAFDFEAELRIVVRSRLRTEVPSQLMSRIAIALEAEQRRMASPPSREESGPAVPSAVERRGRPGLGGDSPSPRRSGPSGPIGSPFA
jgi:anti-sigma factor (TIGR02949 family)